MNKLENVIRVRDVMKSEIDVVDGMLTVTEAMRDYEAPEYPDVDCG